MSKKIIYYYQTFIGLDDILNNINSKVTHIHLSSFHFGTDENNNPYLHLNDFKPDNSKFNLVWNQISEAHKRNIKIIIMLGGAGGAYTDLYSNFDLYYNMLKKFIISKKDIIDGIDLDIEEEVCLTNVIKLIKQLKKDFGEDFIITMAPVQYAMENDLPGLGGFIYKDLYNTCGKSISYFNVQCYIDYCLTTYDNIIKNGYPEDKIIMGSISSQDLNQNLNSIKQISEKYNKFSGVFNWEYFDSPPDKNHPAEWSSLMFKAINNIDNS